MDVLIRKKKKNAAQFITSCVQEFLLQHGPDYYKM